jgi:hypothetical protein
MRSCVRLARTCSGFRAEAGGGTRSQEQKTGAESKEGMASESKMLQHLTRDLTRQARRRTGPAHGRARVR